MPGLAERVQKLCENTGFLISFPAEPVDRFWGTCQNQLQTICRAIGFLMSGLAEVVDIFRGTCVMSWKALAKS
eukprot:2839385-Karenia_brevis.AAC.1